MNTPTGFEALATSRSYFTQESMLAVETRKRKLFIGLPRENLAAGKTGWASRPKPCSTSCRPGTKWCWKPARASPANTPTTTIRKPAPTIVYSADEVYKADILLKVAPPTLEEIELMHSGQTLISAMQMGALSAEYISALMRKKINAIGFEFMKDPSGARPVVRAMSEIAGSTVMLIAGRVPGALQRGARASFWAASRASRRRRSLSWGRARWPSTPPAPAIGPSGLK